MRRLPHLHLLSLSLSYMTCRLNEDVYCIERDQFLFTDNHLLTISFNVNSNWRERRRNPIKMYISTLFHILTKFDTFTFVAFHPRNYAASSGSGGVSPIASIMVAPKRAGDRETCTPASSSAANFSAAPPFPPATMAPA